MYSINWSTWHASRHVLAASIFLLTAVVFSACELDGASKKARTARENTNTDVRQAAPRSSFPMPQAESAHSTQAQGWTLLDGRRARLDDFKGQAVVLDFYATYCPPCLEEIPHLVTLQRRYDADGLKIIGLNVGGEVDQAKVPEFVERFGIQYTLGNPDWELVDAYFGGNSAIPQTLVFDRQGRLVKHFTGYDPQMALQLEEAIQTALATQAASGNSKPRNGGE
jgi:thiol-disulfide isomerase/thioredoxin